MSTLEKTAEWPDFLTVAEVAELLRVSKMTVYRLVHNRELESVKVGRSFRIAASALRAYMASIGYTAPEAAAA